MAIETLAYKLVMDHKQFTQGSIVSRKEIALGKKLMQESLTPAQRMEKSLQSLGALHRKGAIDAKTYASSVEKIKRQFKETKTAGMQNIPVLSNLQSRFAGMAPPMIAATAAIGAGTIALREFKQVAIGVARSIAAEFEEVDRIAKSSRSLGFADPGQLVTFEIAAKRAGLTVAQLNTILKRMNANLGDALEGTGEAAKIIEDKLFLSIDKLAKAEPDVQFRVLAEEISKLPTQIERANAATRIFGRASADVLRLLESDFAAVREEADRMRVTFNSVDGSKIEAANDAVDNLGASMQGISREVALEFASDVKKIADALTRLAELAPSASALITFSGEAMRAAAVHASSWAGSLFAVETGLKGLRFQSDLLFGGSSDIESRSKEIGEAMAKAADAAREAAAAALPEDDFFADLLPREEDLDLSGLGKIDTIYDDIADDINKADAAAKKLSDSFEALVRRNETPMEKLDRQLRELVDLDDAVEGGVGEVFARELDRINDEFDKSTEKAKEFNREVGNTAILAGSAEALALEQRLSLRGGEAVAASSVPRGGGFIAADSGRDAREAEAAKEMVVVLKGILKNTKDPVIVEEVTF